MTLPPIITRIIIAVIVAVVVTLGCYLLGGIMTTLKIDIAVTIGDFLKQWGAVLGVICGLLVFFGIWKIGPTA